MLRLHMLVLRDCGIDVVLHVVTNCRHQFVLSKREVDLKSRDIRALTDGVLAVITMPIGSPYTAESTSSIWQAVLPCLLHSHCVEILEVSQGR